MDRERSALLASWLTFAVSVATLAITVMGVGVAAVALLSIDQVKRVVCRELTYNCGFAAVVVHLLTIDAESRYPAERQPLQESDLVPPLPERAWRLLAHEVDPSGESDDQQEIPFGAYSLKGAWIPEP